MSLNKLEVLFVSDEELIKNELEDVNAILEEGYWIKKMKDVSDGTLFFLLKKATTKHDEEA